MIRKTPLKTIFLGVSAQQPKTPSASPKDAATQTISFRVTEEEKEKLRRDAAGLSRSAYIRELLFGGKTKPRKTRGKFPVKDYEALGRVLGLLGRSGVYNSMHRLMLAVEEGRVALDDDMVAEIRQTLSDVRTMRRDLVQALGLKSEIAK